MQSASPKFQQVGITTSIDKKMDESCLIWFDNVQRVQRIVDVQTTNQRVNKRAPALWNSKQPRLSLGRSLVNHILGSEA